MLAAMSKIPPNRVAVLTGLLTAVAGVVVSLLGAIDTLEKALVACVALVVIAVVLVVYLLGWQRHESRVAYGLPTIDERQLTVLPTDSVPDEHPSDDEPGDVLPALPHLATADPADVPIDASDIGMLGEIGMVAMRNPEVTA